MSRKKLTRNLVFKLTIALVVAVLGFATIRMSGAAGFLVKAEAETGALAGAATALAQQTGSSGGSTVKFGGGSGVFSCDQAGIQKLVDSVSSTNLETNLRKLVQDDSKPTPNELISRHISAPGNKVKVDWAKQMYASYGYEVISQDFSDGSYDLSNAVARLTGSATPNTVYGAGGHIDTTSENKSQVAPGADDNGTGTVAALEAARVLKQFQPCLKSTLEFVAFNDEEEAGDGSAIYADSVKSRSPKGFFNMDMLGAPDGSTVCTHTYYNSDTRDAPFFDQAQTASTKYKIDLTMDKIFNDENNHDTANLWAANQPALFFSQCGEIQDEHYHSTTDNVQYVNFTQVTKVTKVVVAMLAELAME